MSPQGGCLSFFIILFSLGSALFSGKLQSASLDAFRSHADEMNKKRFRQIVDSGEGFERTPPQKQHPEG